ncbi:MAG: S-layer homology domain-containing protein [Ruminococcaceae bacterium]|nr:S-layer homology domain-containing protein [Oscillospiraceae bacterium]
MKNFKKFLTLVLAVMMVVSSMAFSTSAATTKFEDVDADNEALVKAVDLLSYMGVAKGKSETNFGAEEAVTREQFALFIYRLMKGGKDAPANASNTTKFTDLEDSTYFYAISWANAEGIVNGKSETSFGPKDGIKLQEAYAMIVRALDWEEENDLVYPYGHIEVAEQEGVELDKGLDSKVGYADTLTRGDMAILLYNAFFAETGVEEVATREREIGTGNNATWVLEEYTTNPRLCEKAFDVIEVEYDVTATPNYFVGDAEATYDLGYDAVYVEKVEDSEVNADATEAPNAAYVTAEDLGVEAAELNDYFLGRVTMFVTVDDEEIEKVLFADCNMVKKTVTELKLGEVSSNKADSYFAASEGEAKLLSGKITAGEDVMYVFNAPYSYAKETYPLNADAETKYAVRNSKNLKAISIAKVEEDDETPIYTAEVSEIVEDVYDADGFFAPQAEALVGALQQVYYEGLYEADLYDVDGDGIYDYIDYKPYWLFQVDSDEEEYFEDSDFEPGDLSEFDLPYIYTNEATVVGEDFADEDVVIGYYSEANEFVKVAAVVKPVVTTIDSFSKRNGTLTLGNGDVVDAVSAWKLLGHLDPTEEVIFDEDLVKDEIVEDEEGYFTTAVLDSDDELELYVHDGVLLFGTDVDTVSKFSENLFIPTEIKGIKEGPFDPATGSVTYYIYAYVDGDVKYVPVAIDEDIDNPIVDEDGNYNRDYTDTLCTYTVKDGIYTIVPLEFDLLADGDVEKEALSTDVELLDDEKKEEQVFAADLGSTITKIAGSRFDIGFERSVDFKSYSKIIIRVYDAEEDEYEYVEYDAATFKKSLDEETTLENMKAIISNNVDSTSRENLVLLYAETDNLAFAGRADKDGYRIVSVYDIAADAEGLWRNYYELYDPYTGAKVTDVASVEGEKKSGNLQTALNPGTIIELVEGQVEDTKDKYIVAEEISTDNLVWIAEVDEAEGYFVAVPYDESLTDKDEIDAYVEGATGDAINDIYGEEIPGNFIDFDKNTVVSVMKYDEYNSSFWKWGTMSLSNMSAIADAKKEVLCWNDKAEDRSGNFVTKYADYVKAYVSVDAENLDEDENPVAEFIIVIVNGAENAALDA